MSDSANIQQDSARPRRGVGKPFQKGGDPRRGKGFPALTPEQKEAQALKERVAGRVILDLAAEMKTHAAVAVDALRNVIVNGKHVDQINAARVVLSYSHGMPVQLLDARVQFENTSDILTPEVLTLAVRRLAAADAEDAPA